MNILIPKIFLNQLFELDLAQLRELLHRTQVIQPFCIQGWSGITSWDGVSLRTILDPAGPTPKGE